MKNSFLIALLFAIPLFGDSNASYPPNIYETEGGQKAPVTSEANAEAVSWLTLLDQGQYGSAWLDAGSLMKDIVTQEQWEAAMQALRQPLGNVTARKTGTSQTTQSLPGGTRGNFVVINYETSFSFKPTATEKVTLMTNALNQWRVISYDIN